jgi:nitrite reductase (NO-forming)
MTETTSTEGSAENRTVGMVALLAGVAVALVLSAGALIVSAGGGGMSGAGGTAPAAAAAAVDAPSEVSFELDDLTVRPAAATIAPGGTVEVVNAGAIPHDLVVLDGSSGTPMLDSGEAANFGTDSLEPGAYTVICTVPGHREAGMEATLTVAGGVGDHDTHGDVAAATTAAADEAFPGTLSFDPNAAPEDGFTARDPRLGPAPDTDLHEVTIRVSHLQGDVAPGARQELWTFNELVPGPVLRGTVGDTFRITFINDGTMPHSIDFHASKVAPNDEMRTIEPGEQLVYEFEALHAGIWMYHCGTSPVLHHTGNGQYGAVIVDPPDLPEVDHEYVFVQSEFYLGPEGEPGSYAKMLAEAPDIVAFNGYANQYLHDPITEVVTGERVRAWILDAGPSENSSWHVIGTIFDTVYKEGAYRLQPDEGRGGAQALDLQPAQGGFVEFTFDEDGVYPFVTHKFANVPRGAVGAFVVGDVDPDAAAH